MTQYLVGFDRFIAIDWANYALELSTHSDDEAAKVSQLKSWLSFRVSGKDSIRKTANVLTRLWLDDNADTMSFRNDAYKLRICPKIT